MSEKAIRLATIENVRNHPNADRLDIGEVLGWQVVTGRGTYQSGDTVAYFEDGLEIDPEYAEEIGVLNYLHSKTNIRGERVKVTGRVRLRGEPSFGIVLPAKRFFEEEVPALEDGTDILIEIPGVRKFEPPARLQNTTTNVAPDVALFPKYTDIQNLRNFPDVFETGEEVVVTEKIHGTNGRWGFFRDEVGAMVMVAGSRNYRRYPPKDGEIQFEPIGELDPETKASWSNDTYWMPLTHEGVRTLLEAEYEGGAKALIFYGEIFGPGVQSYQYGRTGLDFAVFDVLYDYKGERRFLDPEELAMLMDDYDIPIVPADYVGPYDPDKIKELSELPSNYPNPQGREGVVVRPIKERRHPKIGRVVLKYVSDTYLFGKEAMEHDTTDV